LNWGQHEKGKGNIKKDKLACGIKKRFEKKITAYEPIGNTWQLYKIGYTVPDRINPGSNAFAKRIFYTCNRLQQYTVREKRKSLLSCCVLLRRENLFSLAVYC
jgi:hypothetical protein